MPGADPTPETLEALAEHVRQVSEWSPEWQDAVTNALLLSDAEVQDE
jgi:hypothetical protein